MHPGRRTAIETVPVRMPQIYGHIRAEHKISSQLCLERGGWPGYQELIGRSKDVVLFEALVFPGASLAFRCSSVQCHLRFYASASIYSLSTKGVQRQ